MILRQVSSARSSSRKCCRKKGRASQTREKAKMGVNEQVASVGTWGSILLGSMPRHIRTPAWRVEEPTSRVTTSQSYTLRSALVRCYCWPLGHDSLPFCFSAFQSQFSSVQSLSHVRLVVTPWTAACQAPRPSPSPGAYSNSCPSHHWWHPTISSSVVPFSSCPQSFPASGSFPMSQFFASGGQSIGVSASTSVLPMNTQVWSPLGWTGWIYLQSKGLSKSLL